MLENLQPIWIDSPAGVEGAVRAVRSAGQLALDTEADSLHSYFHKTCLIQVTADGGNFVIDPLAIDPETLADLEVRFTIKDDAVIYEAEEGAGGRDLSHAPLAADPVAAHNILHLIDDGLAGRSQSSHRH